MCILIILETSWVYIYMLNRVRNSGTFAVILTIQDLELSILTRSVLLIIKELGVDLHMSVVIECFRDVEEYGFGVFASVEPVSGKWGGGPNFRFVLYNFLKYKALLILSEIIIKICTIFYLGVLKRSFKFKGNVTGKV